MPGTLHRSDLGLESVTPQDFLCHGTARKNLSSIEQCGPMKRRRHHVHLSSDIQTALKVGSRHGEPAIFRVHAGRMIEWGIYSTNLQMVSG
jgi:putative RNA 2'-phosphotransferase